MMNDFVFESSPSSAKADTSPQGGEGLGKVIDFPLVSLRDYQKEIWKKWVNGIVKILILIHHRRAGKDILSFNCLVEKAIERVGLYWYIFPYQTQARKSFWEASFENKPCAMGACLQSQACRQGEVSRSEAEENNGVPTRYYDLIPREILLKRNDSEMKIELKNGSVIRILGGDNPDALRGANPYGVVFSEYAQHKPSVWSEIIEPIIKANGGWVIFNSTPLGENHCFDMYNFVKKMSETNSQYYASLLTIDDTGVLNEKDIELIRQQGRPEEIIQQEYYCSFAGALTGAYYASIIDRIKDTNILDNITYDGESGVNTAWDLGVSDATAIWFFILKNNRIDVIDYYENSGYGLAHYVRVIQEKKYKYINHYLPHDGGHRTLTADEQCRTIQHQLIELGLQNVSVIDRTKNLYEDIQAVRTTLPICFFDRTKCKDGLMSLKNYRREYDENRKCYKQTPLHDWTSHGSDAFRIIPIVYNERINSKKIINKQPMIWNRKF